MFYTPGAAGIDSYESLSRPKIAHDFGEGIVRVPQPNVNLLAPIIGNRWVVAMVTIWLFCIGQIIVQF